MFNKNKADDQRRLSNDKCLSCLLFKCRINALEVFLEQGCNIAAATDALYVHRNTVKYRIKRIEEIMNIDLKDVTVQFNLRLAFKIMHYLG